MHYIALANHSLNHFLSHSSAMPLNALSIALRYSASSVINKFPYSSDSKHVLVEAKELDGWLQL
jgi:hypothetical protein